MGKAKVIFKDGEIKTVLMDSISYVSNDNQNDPRWPLENPPPVAGSKSPTLRQQNGCKLIQFLF